MVAAFARLVESVDPVVGALATVVVVVVVVVVAVHG